MFVDRSDQAAIEAAVDAGVSAYVVDGLKRERVKPILDMAISRFNAFSRMTREFEEARSELENRKLIDRAKGILMSTRGLTEADAYALLRKTAMNQNRKISEIAESLITAAGLLAPPEDKVKMTGDHQIVAGFMPLLDSAILVAAKEKGFAAAEAIDLVLVRETSWANIRDRMAVGHFQVAHVLAPMPIASNLGLTPLGGADHRAHGARPRRQCGDGVDGALGAA